MCGLEFRYGPVMTNIPVDYGIPEDAITTLSQFCRVAPERIRRLDLRQQVPGLTPALLLGFRHVEAHCTRYRSRRLGYAFCPSCIAIQPVIHVPWEWSLACLSRCPIHRSPLLESCPTCSESDPLMFAGPGSSADALCRSCGGYLGSSTVAPAGILGENEIQAGEDAYRAALVGVPPALLPKATAGAFRLFLEDLLPLLTRSVNRCSRDKTTADSLLRQDILAMIAALVLNAAPNRNGMRYWRGTRGPRLWATLLS